MLQHSTQNKWQQIAKKCVKVLKCCKRKSDIYSYWLNILIKQVLCQLALFIYSAFIIISCSSQPLLSTLMMNTSNIFARYLPLDSICSYLLGMDNAHGVDNAWRLLFIKRALPNKGMIEWLNKFLPLTPQDHKLYSPPVCLAAMLSFWV